MMGLQNNPHPTSSSDRCTSVFIAHLHESVSSMKTDQLRLLSHHYLLVRLDGLSAQHKESLHKHYAELMSSLHENVRVEKGAQVLLTYYKKDLAKGVSAQAAAHRSLDDFIHLHTSFNWRKIEGQKIPVEVSVFRRQIQLDHMYRKAADSLFEGITACLLWSHSAD